MKVAELFILYSSHGEKALSPKIYLPVNFTCSGADETKAYRTKLILIKSVFNTRL